MCSDITLKTSIWHIAQVLIIITLSTVSYAIGGYGNEGTVAVITSVNCIGSEDKLTSCDHVYRGIPIAPCDSGYAGVLCNEGRSIVTV